PWRAAQARTHPGRSASTLPLAMWARSPTSRCALEDLRRAQLLLRRQPVVHRVAPAFLREEVGTARDGVVRRASDHARLARCEHARTPGVDAAVALHGAPQPADSVCGQLGALGEPAELARDRDKLGLDRRLIPCASGHPTKARTRPGRLLAAYGATAAARR